MQYATPSSKDVAQAEAEIRHNYEQYGNATAHPSRITKQQAEAIAASLDNCEFREEAPGVFTFQQIGPRDR